MPSCTYLVGSGGSTPGSATYVCVCVCVCIAVQGPGTEEHKEETGRARVARGSPGSCGLPEAPSFPLRERPSHPSGQVPEGSFEQGAARRMV